MSKLGCLGTLFAALLDRRIRQDRLLGGALAFQKAEPEFEIGFVALKPQFRMQYWSCASQV